MSYILEALKKAQAERQIGSTPTIHAPTLASAPVAQGAGSKRTLVMVSMALMVAVIGGLATMLVRQQQAASQAPAVAATDQAAAAAAAPAAVPAAAVAPAAAPVAAAVGAPPSAAPVGQLPAPRPVAPPPAAVSQAAAPQTVRQPPVPAMQEKPASQIAEAQQQPAAKPAGVAPRAADSAAAAPAPVEELVQSLRDLPEPIQRAIPQITLGGYMYSKNPADRLLLIDKVLRREGEEVAPGLVLDKLQPKQAIFSFRGYRYRVAL
ncbi:general secretion pathway protein GspB [Pseudoduganella violaceinigra]|uniref:general secretion pathway protein GspB n=1 Tax=Pseudoduganella violaceinigra TaxID=246602 RepID=UPI0004275345|nr:general secretion pathway protein GspB [Pseudoduganella violaceinigra]